MRVAQNKKDFQTVNIENITSGIKWWPNLIWSTSLEYNVCMMFGELSFLKNESLGKWYSPFLSWPPGYQSDCRWDITAGPCNWELLLCPPVPCANLEIKISLRTRTYLQQSILTHTYILEIDILWAFRFSWLLLSSPVPPMIQPEIKKYLTTRNHIMLTIEGSVHILCPP